MFEVVIFTPKNIPSEVLPYKISVHWKIAPYSPVAISVENDEAVLFLCFVSPNWKYYLLYSVNSWIFPVQPVHDECFQKYYLYEKETIRVLDLVKTVFFFPNIFIVAVYSIFYFKLELWKGSLFSSIILCGLVAKWMHISSLSDTGCKLSTLFNFLYPTSILSLFLRRFITQNRTLAVNQM